MEMAYGKFSDNVVSSEGKLEKSESQTRNRQTRIFVPGLISDC